eukprot:Trichotokara_eunicae@DN5822_c0_g1_i2.p1
MLESLTTRKQKSFVEFFSNASAEAVDLLKQLLQFNPSKRMSAEEALRHPYVAQFHNLEDEPVCGRVITIPIDDNHKYDIDDYREKVYTEVIKKKKERRGERHSRHSREAGHGSSSKSKYKQ